MCRFWVTADLFNVEDPEHVTQMLRDHGLGEASLEATLTQDPGDPWTYRFPADSVLVMIGETPHLLTACQTAYDAGVLWIKTRGDKPLVLRYVRIKVGAFTTNTLVVVGERAVMSRIVGLWHEYTNLIGWNDKLSLHPIVGGGAPRELPLAIYWIKENDGKAWIPRKAGEVKSQRIVVSGAPIERGGRREVQPRTLAWASASAGTPQANHTSCSWSRPPARPRLAHLELSVGAL